MSDQQDIQNHHAALARFEAHMPLLERVISQVLTGSNGSVRDLVYLGAAVLLRCAAEYGEGSGLTFKEYAEVTVTSELLHHMHYPVPVLRLPHELTGYQARLNAMAQGLAAALPPPSMAMVTYPTMALRHGGMMPQHPMMMSPEFYGAAAPAANGPGMGSMVWSLFKKRMPLILGLVLLTEVGVTALTLKSPKTWVAGTTLNTGIGSNDPINGKGDWFTQGTIVANITELLKSRTVMENTAKALDLKTDPAKLAEHITIARVGQAGLLKIEADAETAEAASELANTTVREFLRYYAGTQSREARSNKGFFESQVKTSKERLAKAENKLMGFKQQRVPEMEAQVPQRVSELMSQRDQLRRELAGVSSALGVAESEYGRVKADPLLSSKIMNQAPVQTATEKLRDLEMNLMDARDIYGADSPVVKTLKDQIARQKGRLRTTQVESFEQNPALAETRAKVAGLRTDVARASAQLAATERQLAQLAPQAGIASGDQVRLEQLVREVKLADMQYTDLTTKFGQQSMLAQGATNLTMTVVDGALPPKEPLSNKLALKLVLGLILSLGLGMFISYLMSLREKPEAEAEAATTASGTKVVLHQGAA
ncbi:MAG: hypothetical protein JWM80_5007 [Cyanobacteria bacterium RYN_339]|nr:hypothetical protein [Cyanobacteria bacterium RYN_339]